MLSEHSDRILILNLTQHPATPEQLAAGVVEPASGQAVTSQLLTFQELPAPEKIRAAAEGLAELAIGYRAAMIGGAPWLMEPLARALRARGIQPLYAFSRREAAEERLPDGSVRKTSVFRHVGFIEG